MRLPGRWLQLEPEREGLNAARIERYVRAQCGTADDAARLRAGTRQSLESLVKSTTEAPARDAHLQSLFVCSSVAPPTPSPLLIAVYTPRDLSMTPALATDAESVIAVFEQAVRSGALAFAAADPDARPPADPAASMSPEGNGNEASPGVDEAVPGIGEPASALSLEDDAAFLQPESAPPWTGQWTRHTCADGLALARWTVRSHELAGVGSTEVFRSEHWRTIPGSRRLALIEFTSPIARIPATMHRLARALAATSRFAAA